MTGRIDWKEQFDQLTPLLQGRGKIVRVNYESPQCAHTAFTTTLIAEYEAIEKNNPWKWVVIDRNSYNTRYLRDILNEFSKKLDIPISEESSCSMTVGSHINAGGNVRVELHDITIHQPEIPQELHVPDLCSHLKDYLQNGRFMVIVNHHKSKQQSDFWNLVWAKGLADLVGDGMTLVHFVDTSDKKYQPHRDTPVAHITITLPTFLGPAAQTHAIEDIVRILKKEIPSSKYDPQSWAHSAVTMAYDDISKLHVRLAAHVMSSRQGSSS